MHRDIHLIGPVMPFAPKQSGQDLAGEEAGR